MTPNDVLLRISAAYERGEIVVVCAWCERIRLDGAWQGAPDGVFADFDVKNVLSHSICGPCVEAIVAHDVASDPPPR